jgi:hypothetical protein
MLEGNEFFSKPEILKKDEDFRKGSVMSVPFLALLSTPF